MEDNIDNIALGMVSGVILGCILLGILYLIYLLFRSLIIGVIDYFERRQFLRKRNKHRIKCGLTKINKFN